MVLPAPLQKLVGLFIVYFLEGNFWEIWREFGDFGPTKYMCRLKISGKISEHFS